MIDEYRAGIIYAMKEGFIGGFIKSFARSFGKGVMQTARKLKTMGFPIERIAEAMELTDAQFKALEKARYNFKSSEPCEYDVLMKEFDVHEIMIKTAKGLKAEGFSITYIKRVLALNKAEVLALR